VVRTYTTMGFGPFEPEQGKPFFYVSVEVENPTSEVQVFDTVQLTSLRDSGGGGTRWISWP